MNAHELLRQRRADWDALEDLLSRFSSAQNRANATPEELSRFASLFRSTCADLDRARAQGLSDDLVDYLNSLAARAHNLFYVAPPARRGAIARFFQLTLPLTIRRNATYVAAGLFLFYAPMIATIALATTNEDTLYQLIPKKTLEKYEQMYERGHEQGRDETKDMAMTGSYVRNNVGIAFTCFSTGFFFGVGSLFFLVFNGVMIGAVVGFLSNSPVAMNLLSFIVGHGPFELTAIGLSGAAGLRLGFGALTTANRPRGQSLRLAARDAVELVAGAAMLLLGAALIEGFFSPSSLPMGLKFAFGGVCVLFLFFYLAYWPWRQGRLMRPEEEAIA